MIRSLPERGNDISSQPLQKRKSSPIPRRGALHGSNFAGSLDASNKKSMTKDLAEEKQANKNSNVGQRSFQLLHKLSNDGSKPKRARKAAGKGRLAKSLSLS